MTILDFLDSPQLLKVMFREPETWRSWRVFLAALYGLGFKSDAEGALFRASTGLEACPASDSVREAFVIAGRRGGKSTIAAALSVFAAASRDWRTSLAPGERAWIFLLAVDKLQARVLRGYVLAALKDSPVLSALLEKTTAEEIYLRNGAVISIKSASFRGVRGYSIPLAVCEELSFWRSEESANPDREIITALRPALATIPGSLLIGISSPYSRRGVLYDEFKTHYGQPGQTLVWRADSRTMNPSLPAAVVEKALEADPEAAKAEWLAEFRSDLADYISPEELERCVITGRYHLPRVEGFRYSAFIDPAGGSGRDSFTLAIAHHEGCVLSREIPQKNRPKFPMSGWGIFL
jgi:hypothetical protein